MNHHDLPDHMRERVAQAAALIPEQEQREPFIKSVANRVTAHCEFEQLENEIEFVLHVYGVMMGPKTIVPKRR
jgi:hypothetical protein